MQFEDLLNEKKKLEEEPTITTTSLGNSSTEGGSANFPKKIGSGLKSIGRTSTDAGHDHEAFVGSSGNGQTSPGKKNGHIHIIQRFKVQPADSDNHKHTLKR
jgi:hypothetical protein